MPQRRASLRITETYRHRMVALRTEAQRAARATWRKVDPHAIDETYEVGMLALRVEVLQRESARLSGGYLQAFIESELGRSVGPPMVDARQVGSSRAGGTLRDALRSPVIAAKARIGNGEDPRQALALERSRLERIVGLATDTAAREALRHGMEDSPYVVGWRRAVRGTCGACVGAVATSAKPPGESLRIHPNCQCVAEPSVYEVPKAPKDYASIDDQGHGRWNNGVPKMSPGEQVALHDYVAPATYEATQTYWRDRAAFERMSGSKVQGSEIRDDPRVTERARASRARYAELLKDAIDVYGKSWEGDQMWRVTRVPSAILDAMEAGKPAEFVEPGFLSVGRKTNDVAVIAKRTQSADAPLLRVRIRSRRPGISPSDNGLRTFEEIVFGPGTRLRFLGKAKIDRESLPEDLRDKDVYDVELI